MFRKEGTFTYVGNFTTLKMSTGPSVYYKGYGNYNIPKISFEFSPSRTSKKTERNEI